MLTDQVGKPGLSVAWNGGRLKKDRVLRAKWSLFLNPLTYDYAHLQFTVYGRNRHTHSFHKCRLCSHASVGLAQAPIILCFWKATTLTNFRSNPLFGLQKTPPSPAVCKGPTSLTVIESHRRPNNCGCCCAPWLVAIDVATSHAIAEFARLY